MDISWSNHGWTLDSRSVPQCVAIQIFWARLLWSGVADPLAVKIPVVLLRQWELRKLGTVLTRNSSYQRYTWHLWVAQNQHRAGSGFRPRILVGMKSTSSQQASDRHAFVESLNGSSRTKRLDIVAGEV
jgi:hypothetical protein